jgi:hypothetical protein
MGIVNKKTLLQIIFWLILAALLIFAAVLVDLKYFEPQIALKEQAIAAGAETGAAVEIDLAALKSEIANDQRFGALKLQAETPLAIDKTKINKKENPFK